MSEDETLTDTERAELARRLDNTLDIAILDGEYAVDADDLEWEETHIEITVNRVKLPTADSTEGIPEYDTSMEMAIENAVRGSLNELPVLTDQNATVSAAIWEPEQEQY